MVRHGSVLQRITILYDTMNGMMLHYTTLPHNACETTISTRLIASTYIALTPQSGQRAHNLCCATGRTEGNRRAGSGASTLNGKWLRTRCTCLMMLLPPPPLPPRNTLRRKHRAPTADTRGAAPSVHLAHEVHVPSQSRTRTPNASAGPTPPAAPGFPAKSRRSPRAALRSTERVGVGRPHGWLCCRPPAVALRTPHRRLQRSALPFHRPGLREMIVRRSPLVTRVVAGSTSVPGRRPRPAGRGRLLS